MSREIQFKVKGIISVLQTPFDTQKQIDWDSYERLIEHAIHSGVNGFLAPAVASEVAYLTLEEREQIVRFVAEQTRGCVSFIVGASAATIDECQHFARLAETVGAEAYLIAVTAGLYQDSAGLVPSFQRITTATSLPLIIQDLLNAQPPLLFFQHFLLSCEKFAKCLKETFWVLTWSARQSPVPPPLQNRA